MGIHRLHPNLRFLVKKGKLRDYKGKTAAVDVSIWYMCKAVYGCSVNVIAGCIIWKSLYLMENYGFKAVCLVADGKRIPLKGVSKRELDTYDAVMKRVEELIRGVKRIRIIDAPKEADAQLVQACKDGIADVIITEVRPFLHWYHSELWLLATHSGYSFVLYTDRIRTLWSMWLLPELTLTFYTR